MNPLADFLFLVFPKICITCGNSLLKSEEVICTSCFFHLPKTNFHLNPENHVTRTFWGRVRIESGVAYLYFNKGNRVQKLIHHLKYKGRRDVGVFLGKRYGDCLKKNPVFQTIDFIIPVPLHEKKLKLRGYNQSEAFADGLSQTIGVPVDIKSLVRIISTETQTRKSRFRRWENVAEIFSVQHPESLINKHILLVDDVITTGATMESCINALAFVSGIRISVAAIATTKG